MLVDDTRNVNYCYFSIRMVSYPDIRYNSHVHTYVVRIHILKGTGVYISIVGEREDSTTILFSVLCNVSTDRYESWLPSKRSTGLSPKA